MLEADMKVL